MQSKLLSKKVLGSILALGALTVSSTALANSGGYEDGSHYVGNYSNGSNVILDTKIDGIVYGSRVLEGTASNNTVTVSADCKGVAGASVGTGDVIDNNVIINSGTTGNVYGGRVETGNATGNSVTVNGGDVYSAVGASVDFGNAEGNSVVINADTKISRVAGAIVDEGNAVNNYVEINSGEINNGYIYGAKVETGNAEGNVIVINDGSINSRVYAARVENGDAVNNVLIINGGTINADNGATNGTFVHEGNARNNAVVINGGEIHSSLDGSIVMTFGNSTGNSVTINDGEIYSYSITGGYVNNGNAENNNVTINDGAITNTQSIKGGVVLQGNATGNSVVINGGKIVKEQDERTEIYGASVTKGNAEGNAVIINGGEISFAEIVGANVRTGDALNNYVIVNGGQIEYSPVYGAKVETGNAAGNMVVINNSSTGDGVHGALITEKGDAKDNTVIINGGSISGTVNGAGTDSDNIVNVSGNGVIFNEGSVDYGSINGASIRYGTAEGNYVIVNSDKLTEQYLTGIHGAHIIEEGTAVNNLVIFNSDNTLTSSLSGAYVNIGTVTGNVAVVNRGTITSEYEVSGAYVVKGNADKNQVYINGGNINTKVYGAYADLGDALNNSVVINGGKVAGAVYGGRTGEGNAEGNTVIINGGSISGSICGGCAEQGDTQNNYVVINDGNASGWIFGGYTAKGDALNNQVNINGGKITGTVYGGYADEGKAEGNVITISGDADLSEATLIAGAEGNNSGKLLLSDNTAGENTIRLNGWSGSVAGISGTDVIEINGSKLTKNGILHIKDTGNTSLSGTTVKVNSIAGGQNLTTGSEIEIITAEDKTDLSGIKTEVTENGILAGVTGIANGEITTDADGNVIFKVSEVQLQKQTAITTETRAAAAAMVNQGSEVIADSISKLQYEDAGVSTFATISGNNSKYKTGSYVDINGWNGIVGAAKTKVTNSGKLSYGAFFENGSGNYNTYNDFNGNVLRGDGNAVYNGGGLLLRHEKADGIYTEASVRAGLAKNEVSHALAETSGAVHGFKTENAYYGAHVGIGKVIELEKGKAWDIYGKYFYTHHEGDSVTIANDNFDFDAINSSKLRLGARFSEQQSHKLSSYYGLAWDYEFSGEAGGTAAGHSLYAPSLEGSTVIGELGFRYTPDKAGGWYFDAALKGYAGQQEGLSGSVQAVYSF